MSLMRNSLAIGAVAFLAYCVYFDRKRRSDPEFKAKLKQKRLNAKKSREMNNESEIPIFKDPSEMQEYFLKEVQISDQLLMTGNFEEAALHLANATVVCSQKTEFLGVMHKTLPAPVFQLLIQYYQAANERYSKRILQMGANGQSSSAPKPQFLDTDIE